MRESLTACWEVRAGIIPGQPEPEFSKKFPYTSHMREEDESHKETIAHLTHFNRVMSEAMMYYMTLQHPQRLNWVELSWVWF